ncbi:MAG: alpha/beta hydrolase [Saprospiraceae bacterium]|nr:alpha/beta hydrolase [Saprospiraceae bacterium]
MKNIFLIVFALFMIEFQYAQNLTLPLWSGEIPNSKKVNEVEKHDTTDNIIRISNVQTPDIAVFLPSKANATGQAVVICPGGGYWILAYDWEGTDIAKWLNSKGIAAIVLKYRLPVSKNNITPHLSPLMDAQRAMRLTRHHAKEWNIDTSKVGIMGFSAGGHLASTVGTHFDYGNSNATDPVEKWSSRPDFMILMYPVITFSQTVNAHIGSRNALLGQNPDPTLIEYYSNELQVKADTPPTILIHAGDDKAVPVENSLLFYQALKNNNIPAELHIYPFGGHGFSLAINKGYLETWTERCVDWLKSLK